MVGKTEFAFFLAYRPITVSLALWPWFLAYVDLFPLDFFQKLNPTSPEVLENGRKVEVGTTLMLGDLR